MAASGCWRKSASRRSSTIRRFGSAHPGDEISYIIEGEATLMLAGQPPRQVKGGEGFVIPAGVLHNARNDSASPIRLVGVYVVDKDKPLASPAAAPAQ